MHPLHFLPVAQDLEQAGLVWQPEVGDEVAPRHGAPAISILVDPQGMGPLQLRETYLWLPNLEQLVLQLEARQAVLFHVGLELSEARVCYKAIVQAGTDKFESAADTPRSAVGIALRKLLLGDDLSVH